MAFALQEDVRNALGVNDDGTCCRHPNIPIYTPPPGFDLGNNNLGIFCGSEFPTIVSTCRICQSEEDAGGIRQRKSFAATIKQVQRLHANKTEWSHVKQNWGPIQEITQEGEEKKDKESSSSVAAPDHTNDNSTSNNGGTNSSLNHHNKNSSTTNKSAMGHLISQLTMRMMQVQDWVMTEKEKEFASATESLTAKEIELHKLQTELKALRAIADDQTNKMQQMQEHIEKQDRTIQQDLKMIKTIALKRASKVGQSPSLSSSSSSPKRKSMPSVVADVLPLIATSSNPGDYNDDVSAPASLISQQSQEAPPRQPTRKRSQKPDRSSAPTDGAAREGSDADTSATREQPPKAPVRQSSHQHYSSPAISVSSKHSKQNMIQATLGEHQEDYEEEEGLQRQILPNSHGQPSDLVQNSSPPTLPQRQHSTNESTISYDSMDSSLAPSSVPTSVLFSGGETPPATMARKYQKGSSDLRPDTTEDQLAFVAEGGHEHDDRDSEDEDRLSVLRPKDQAPPARSAAAPGRMHSRGLQPQPPSDRNIKSSEPSQSHEIAFYPSVSDVEQYDIGFSPTISKVLNSGTTSQSSSPPPPPPPDGNDTSTHSHDVHFTASLSSSDPPVAIRSSQEIQFDASKLMDGQEMVRRSSSVAEMQFDPSQQLLLEASQALTTPLQHTHKQISTPSQHRKQISHHQQQSQQQIEVAAAELPAFRTGITTVMAKNPDKLFSGGPVTAPAPSPFVSTNQIEVGASELPAFRTGVTTVFANNPDRIFENHVSPADVEVEEDDDDEEFDEDDFPADLPITGDRYLDVERSGNVSPVSALTTATYMLEQQLGGKSPMMEDDDEEENDGPHKGLHGGGGTKLLPMERDLQLEEGSDEENNEDDEVDEGGDTFRLGGTLDFSSGPRPPITQKSQHPHLQGGFVKPEPRRIPTGVDKKQAKRTYEVKGQIVQDKYGDGGDYTGSVSLDDNLPHGFGKMQYDNDRQYEGEWRNGRWHGYGKWVNPNGDCYEGSFVYDARHGKGVYAWRNGNVYRGDFFEDKRQGQGVFNFANGNVYNGEFVNGVFEGVGRYEFEGGYYEGEWKAGRYHGQGFLCFADGSNYKGEFLDGVAHGRGEETDANGISRSGYWEAGKPAGL